jgi:hypothetical protein
MSDRVDKQWKDKGLAGYSVAAIIGTLNHYGVKLDEAAIKEAAKERSPLELSLDWKPSWKGTGQWAAFPWAAANELIVRFYPERPTPMRVAAVLMEAVAQGLRLVAGKESDAAVPLATFEELAAKLPPPGERRDAFLREFVGFIESWAKPFNELPEQLAKLGHKDLALRFAQTHERLFPDRVGCVTALVRAASGERDAAVADLTGWAGEATRDVFARYAALDVLYQLEAWPPVKAHGLAVFDLAAKEEKWQLADSVAHLLAHTVNSSETDPAFVKQVEQRLELAHGKTGGHHH